MEYVIGRTRKFIKMFVRACLFVFGCVYVCAAKFAKIPREKKKLHLSMSHLIIVVIGVYA
jgi:hypothetical protein